MKEALTNIDNHDNFLKYSIYISKYFRKQDIHKYFCYVKRKLKPASLSVYILY